ncbi:hypothetical protein [Acuticoccus sediminis]|uniref:hypothetical protein n=1 Tax=Acuticoccus sediminis TaxID=2184697 RepID=UPI001CFE14C2|nr:hypothetical protein [Acuticoccus sediminis]
MPAIPTAAALLGVLAAAGAMTGGTAADIGPSGAARTPSLVANAAGTRDAIVGKWTVYPAVGPSPRSCTITFEQGPGGTRGRATPFACHQVEGLGGLHGFADISAWERRGRTVVLSGIAAPGIGSIELAPDAGSREVRGSVKGVRFVLKRR